MSVMAVSGMAILTFILRAGHILSSSALFGAMFYSIAVLQPRAKRYFDEPRQFEEFIAFVSNGARWKMLAGFALIAMTGFMLMRLRGANNNRIWTGLICAKISVLIVMVCFFSFVSWRLWPAHIFATTEEIPKFQRLFRFVAFTMMTLVTLEFILAFIAHSI